MGQFSGGTRRRRVLATAAVAFMATATLSGVPAAAPAGARSGVVGSDPWEQPDLDSASLLARQSDHEVEVTGLRGEAEDTWANPDGTFTLRSYASPVRVRRGADWALIDTTLARVDGAVIPTAIVADLRFSAGGGGPLATIGQADKELSLSWLGALPAPTLVGSSATYANVLPGVNLIVRAEPEGFSQVLEVRDRTAAANPALRSIRFGTSSNGLALKDGPDGSVAAVDGAGVPVFISPGSFAWDSSAPDSPGDCSEPAPEEQQLPMPVAIDAGGLTVTPDETLLTSPDTVFPVCIDPPFTGYTNKWTHVWKANPNSSYWGSYRDSMRVGRVWNGGSNDVWRSFVRINIGGIVNQNVQIVSATFRSMLDHSASCSPTSVELWHTNFVSPTSPPTTWNNTNSFGGAGFWKTYLAVAAGNANEAGGCGGRAQPDMLMEWGGGTLRDAVQGMANDDFGIMTFGLKAAVETDGSKWKRFYPGDSATSWQKTYLSVTFNRKPSKPTLQPLAPCYLACSSPAIVRSTTPTLKVGVHDVDNPSGAVLRTWFEVWDPAHTTLVTKNTTAVMATSGGSPPWTPPGGSLAIGSTYHWRVQVVDELGFPSDWSDWGVFSVDTIRPADPSVTSPNYPQKQWGPAEGTVASFNLAPGPLSGAVAEYWWSIDGFVSPTKVPTSDGTETLTWATRGVVNRLQVYAVDRAGNIGTTKSYEFWVTPTANRFSEWRLDETSGNTAADTGKNMLAPLPGSLSAGVSWTAGRVNNAARFSATGTVTTAGSVLDTTRSFSVAAWVRPGTLPAANATAVSQDGTKQSMFRLYYQGSDQRWCFSMRPADDAGAAPTVVCSAVTLPQANQWAHLVGVYDKTAATLSLYVNGGPDGDGSSPDVQAPFTSPWMATGPLAIGRAKAASGNAPGEYFGGDVDEVVAAQRALGPVEIGQLAGGGRLS